MNGKHPALRNVRANLLNSFVVAQKFVVIRPESKKLPLGRRQLLQYHVISYCRLFRTLLFLTL